MDILNFAWELVNKISVIFGLLATIFSGFAALKLWQQNRRLKELAKTTPVIQNFEEQIEYYKGTQTSNPVAFALSLIPRGESIKNSVQTYLNSQDLKMDIVELNMNGINNENDLQNFINELRIKRRLFDAQHVTELHLFFAGPVAAAIITGSVLDNWIPVKLYHKPTPSPPAIYEYWMPLIK